MKTIAVIPAHNESRNIGKVLPRVKKYVDAVIVVDDGSKDNTADVAKKFGAIVVSHAINLGKGAALKTGCDLAENLKAEHIVVMDADGQHQPKDIPQFIRKLKESDIVIGYRTPNNRMPIVFRIGNSAIEAASFLLFGLHIKDTQCGFRAFNRRIYKNLRWKSADYSVESEMIARIGKEKIKYAQIPIETIYVDKYKGTTIIDGIKIVLNMIRWRILGTMK